MTQPQGQGATDPRFQKYVDRLLDGMVLAVPTGLITWLGTTVLGPLTDEPWRILLVAVPLGALAWWYGRSLKAGAPFRLRGPYLVFLICYLSLFGLAAASDLLVWRRTLTGFDDAALPRHWVLPAKFGDWRYRLAARPAREASLLVLTMDPARGEKRNAARHELANLLAFATGSGVRGIALDFYFDDVPSDADGFICRAVAQAGVPVVVGYAVRSIGDEQVRQRDPPTLAECLGSLPRGHLLGYVDADRVVRHVPLRLAEPAGSEALSLQAAGVLAPAGFDLRVPESGLLQFLEPEDVREPIPLAEFLRLPPRDRRDLLQGRFLLVGEHSDEERFSTPFGERLGVQIHAAAIHSLLAGVALRRVPWWSTLLIIIIGGYIVGALAASGASPARLAGAAAVISGFVVIAAIAALVLYQVWLEVIYACVAVWGLVLLFLLSERALRRRERASTGSEDAPPTIPQPVP